MGKAVVNFKMEKKYDGNLVRDLGEMRSRIMCPYLYNHLRLHINKMKKVGLFHQWISLTFSIILVSTLNWIHIWIILTHPDRLLTKCIEHPKAST